MGDRWGREGPPLEAYERVTNPERFRPLHGAALALLDRLTAEFDVERSEGFGLEAELESGEPERPSVRLVPRDPNAATIVVTFTSFPGIRARFGRWYAGAFPTCGCDACDESAEEEIDRLHEEVLAVTSGGFSEAIRYGGSGSAWLTLSLSSPRGSSSGETLLDHSQAEAMLAASDRTSHEWAAWTRRQLGRR
jgi:uncharacterized protein DUF6226